MSPHEDLGAASVLHRTDPGNLGQPRCPVVPTSDPSRRNDELVFDREWESHLCILSLIQNTFN